VGKRRAVAKPRPVGISDAAWAEATLRAAVIRPVCTVPWVGRVVIAAAAQELGLRSVRVYALMVAFRSRPVTASLVWTCMPAARADPGSGGAENRPAAAKPTAGQRVGETATSGGGRDE
jgi:hypothetical protein